MPHSRYTKLKLNSGNHGPVHCEPAFFVASGIMYSGGFLLYFQSSVKKFNIRLLEFVRKE